MSLELVSDAIFAALYLLLSGAVVVMARHWAGRVPGPLVVVACLFGVRGIAKLLELSMLPSAVLVIAEGVIDALLAGCLVAMLWSLGPLVRGAAAATDAARFRASEYGRAQRDYERVMLHRLRNPIAIVKGSAITLRDDVVNDEACRKVLLDQIIEACATLEQVSLEPGRRDASEHGVDAVPHLAPSRGRSGRRSAPG